MVSPDYSHCMWQLESDHVQKRVLDLFHYNKDPYWIHRENHNIQKFHLDFMNEILLPLIKRNIQLQLDAGVEIVMVFDSGLNNLDTPTYINHYVDLISDLANSFPKKIGYYSRGKQYTDLEFLFSLPLAGIGIDSDVSISKIITNYEQGFVQGNFDQTKMLMSTYNLTNEINKFCDEIQTTNKTVGWICSLGHGVDKNTPEKNVHLFIDTIRKRFL